MTSSAVLAMNQAYNEIETDIHKNLVKIDQSISEKFENTLLNYFHIIKLGLDIQNSTNNEKKDTQQTSFEENLEITKGAQPELIESINDTLVMDLNVEIDDAYIKFNQNYRDILKIIDTFQLKITQYHNVLIDFPQIPKELNQIAEIAQDFEEEISDFKRSLHLNLEPLVFKSISKFDKILSQILNDFMKKIIEQANFVQYIEDTFQNIDNILQEMLDNLRLYVSDFFYEHSENLDKTLLKLTNAVQNCFLSIQSIQFPKDNTFDSELVKLDEKITEYQVKLQKLISPLK